MEKSQKLSTHTQEKNTLIASQAIQLYYQKFGVDFSYIPWLEEYNPEIFTQKKFIDLLMFMIKS